MHKTLIRLRPAGNGRLALSLLPLISEDSVGWEPVRKLQSGGVAPNLGDYGRACAEFFWTTARAALDGLPGGQGLNTAWEESQY